MALAVIKTCHGASNHCRQSPWRLYNVDNWYAIYGSEVMDQKGQAITLNRITQAALAAKSHEP